MRALLLFAIILFSSQVFSATSVDLKSINRKIGKIKIVLSKEKNQREIFLKRLQAAEIASGYLELQLRKTESTLKKQSKILKRLNHDQSIYQTKLTTQRHQLTNHLRAAYTIGQIPYPKLLLSQNDADHISHLIMYYRYLSKNQFSTIRDLRITLAYLQNNKTTIQTQTQILQHLQKQQRNEQAHLESFKYDRKRAIAELNNKIQTKSQRLTELLVNKKLLEQTLSQLEKQHQIENIIKRNFSALKGKLNWPTCGIILPCFGTPIEQSELKWDGILIQASENQPVYAIASGKVVFAKWLSGYGLLLIISHGNGYMTLYGWNHNLYKRPTETVQKGELIATVGRSDNYKKPALYFAIRHDAKPLNPLLWCREKN